MWEQRNPGEDHGRAGTEGSVRGWEGIIRTPKEVPETAV